MVTTQVTNRPNSSAVEHQPIKLFVAGSNPVQDTIAVFELKAKGVSRKVAKAQSTQGCTMQARKVWEGRISKILTRSWMSISIGLYRLPVVGGLIQWRTQ